MSAKFHKRGVFSSGDFDRLPMVCAPVRRARQHGSILFVLGVLLGLGVGVLL